MDPSSPKNLIRSFPSISNNKSNSELTPKGLLKKFSNISTTPTKIPSLSIDTRCSIKGFLNTTENDIQYGDRLNEGSPDYNRSHSNNNKIMYEDNSNASEGNLNEVYEDHDNDMNNDNDACNVVLCTSYESECDDNDADDDDLYNNNTYKDDINIYNNEFINEGEENKYNDSVISESHLPPTIVSDQNTVPPLFNKQDIYEATQYDSLSNMISENKNVLNYSTNNDIKDIPISHGDDIIKDVSTNNETYQQQCNTLTTEPLIEDTKSSLQSNKMSLHQRNVSSMTHNHKYNIQTWKSIGSALSVVNFLLFNSFVLAVVGATILLYINI
jgi:hypothetical protein